MKIFDCFTYNGEAALLRLRLETLKDHVDHFVIAEANKQGDCMKLSPKSGATKASLCRARCPTTSP